VLALLLAAAATAPPPARFIHVDTKHHVVDVTLVASYDGANDGYNFDGYSRELLWTVPLGWRVDVSCQNKGQERHSCAVVANASASRPAFAGAETSSPFIGLESGSSQSFHFRATKAGVFRFADLVPGHEQARMYDVLQIARGAKPSVRDLTAP